MKCKTILLCIALVLLCLSAKAEVLRCTIQEKDVYLATSILSYVFYPSHMIFQLSPSIPVDSQTSFFILHSSLFTYHATNRLRHFDYPHEPFRLSACATLIIPAKQKLNIKQ